MSNFQPSSSPDLAGVSNVKEAPSDRLSTSKVKAWMVSYLAELLEMDPDEVDTDVPFDRYGLDSSAAVGMTGELEEWLGTEIDPTVIYDYPTVDALSAHLCVSK